MERNCRMELQYEGTGLHGWAKQGSLPTVEGSLELAFRTACGRVPKLRVAGRTDAGVHALRQVVSLSIPAGTDLGRLRTSLNALTPPGVVVTRIVRAPAGFDARRDATSRIYRYFLSTLPVIPPFWRRYCWHVSGPLNLDAMCAAAGAVVGRHDFRAFTPTETGHVFFNRVVLRCSWKHVRGAWVPVAGRVCAGGQVREYAAGMFCLEIEAESFLRHMVRTLVGTMLEVGQGRRSLDDFERLLQEERREEAGRTGPAQGLFLWDVKYGRAKQLKDPRDPRRGQLDI